MNEYLDQFDGNILTEKTLKLTTREEYIEAKDFIEIKNTTEIDNVRRKIDENIERELKKTSNICQVY